MNMPVTGSPFDYIFAFGSGVLISFTPCVYPLVPVVIGFIGARGAQSRWRGFILSLSYSLGLALTYSVLGVIAVLSGKLFGSISSHPLSYIILGNVCILAGMYMFEVFDIPFFGITLWGKPAGKDAFSAFILGLSSGLVVGPCTTPALGAILAVVAKKQNIFYGATLLFSFAVGMNALLIVLGTFSSLISALPKSGRWMVSVKKACGAILILAGEYFLITGGKLLV